MKQEYWTKITRVFASDNARAGSSRAGRALTKRLLACHGPRAFLIPLVHCVTGSILNVLYRISCTVFS